MRNVKNPIIQVGEDEFLLYNPFTKTADVIDREVFTALSNPGGLPEDVRAFLERHGHYLSDSEGEKMAEAECFRAHAQLSATPQYYLIPTYNCNMRCTYCYEKDLRKERRVMDSTTLENFFRILKEGDTVILYGGEPLQRATKWVVEQVANFCRENRCTLSTCTNGLELKEFEDLFDYFSEIMITLDGIDQVQNERRPAVRGNSFSRVVESIERVIEEGTPLTISVNADSQNVDYLPQLAEFITSKGWHTLPTVTITVSHIMQSLDRSYPHVLEPRDAAQKMVALYREHPQMEIFLHSMKGSNPLVNVFFTGEEWRPKYWYCGANCYMLFFDPYRFIYPCYMVIGRPAFAVGKFDETVEFFPALKTWRERSCFTLPTCRECTFSYFCGGGCAYRQYLRSGSLSDPYCDVTEGLKTWYVPFLYETVKRKGDRL